MKDVFLSALFQVVMLVLLAVASIFYRPRRRRK